MKIVKITIKCMRRKKLKLSSKSWMGLKFVAFFWAGEEFVHVFLKGFKICHEKVDEIVFSYENLRRVPNMSKLL